MADIERAYVTVHGVSVPEVFVDNGDGTYSRRVALAGAVQLADLETLLDNLKTLLAGGLPAALGSLGGLKVDPQYTTMTLAGTGEIAGATSATQCPTLACKRVKFKAVYDNAGYVYLGGATVTKKDGTTDTTTGWILGAGEETDWLPAANLNEFYRICDNAGDDLVYIAYV